MREPRKLIQITMTRCSECPHSFEVSRMTDCKHPLAPGHDPFFDWLPIPEWCPLPDAEQSPEETTP